MNEEPSTQTWPCAKFQVGMIRNKNHARNDAEKKVFMQIIWSGPVKMVTSLPKKGTWKEGSKPILLKNKNEIPNCGYLQEPNVRVCLIQPPSIPSKFTAMNIQAS